MSVQGRRVSVVRTQTEEHGQSILKRLLDSHFQNARPQTVKAHGHCTHTHPHTIHKIHTPGTNPHTRQTQDPRKPNTKSTSTPSHQTQNPHTNPHTKHNIHKRTRQTHQFPHQKLTGMCTRNDETLQITSYCDIPCQSNLPNMGVDTRFAETLHVPARCSPVCSSVCSTVLHRLLRALSKLLRKHLFKSQKRQMKRLFAVFLSCFDADFFGAGDNQHEHGISCVSPHFFALLGVSQRFFAFSSVRCLTFLRLVVILSVSRLLFFSTGARLPFFFFCRGHEEGHSREGLWRHRGRAPLAPGPRRGIGHARSAVAASGSETLSGRLG